MTCEKAGRGRRRKNISLTQVRRSVLPRLLPCMVCAAASAFLLYRADYACVYAAGFVSRSAHFVFTGQRAPVEVETGFFAPYMACPVCDWEPQTGPPPKKSFITVFLSYFPRLRTPTQLGRERAARCYRRKPWTYFSVLMERRLRNRIETNDDIERNGGVKKNKVRTSVSRNKKILSRKELENLCAITQQKDGKKRHEYM